MHLLIKSTAVMLLSLALSGCYGMRPSAGGGKLTRLPETGERAIDPGAIALPAGYRI